MASHPEHFYTPTEYLALERKAAYRSEYYSGEIFAMTGASREHNIIVLNVGGDLNTQLETRECEVYSSEMRVRTPDTSLYTYPDIVAVCGQPRFDDDSFDTLLNPTVIVEVLSPSTEGYDRTRKFAGYRKIDSLTEYVLIAQQEHRVTQFIKQPHGEWLFRETSALGDSVHLPSVDCHLPLTRIYRKVQFQ
jgi:Uma2 family endonuclease